MPQHLDRPFSGSFPVTQVYANLNPMEPLGYLYTDGAIGYAAKPGATRGHYHNGTDYALPCGTPLLACADGMVVFAGWDVTGFGNRISVDHGDGLQTLVAHLQEIDVKVSQKVTRGQRMGFSGTTGNSTGCHTHWSVQVGNEYVSPLPYLNAPIPQPSSNAPANAAAAVEVLARHAADLKAHPSVADTNALTAAIAKWPRFTT